MSIAVLFGSKKAGKIGELQLDATIREVYDYQNEITQYPVEDGLEISDHIKINPDVYTIDGFVTNSPVNILQQNNAEVVRKVNGEVEVKNLKRTEVNNSVELAHDQLLKISGRKIEGGNTVPQLVTVVSGLRVFHDMAIENLNIPRDASTGEAIPFTCRLVHVVKVDTETITIPNPAVADKDKASSTVDVGQKQTKTASTKTTADVSSLKSAWNSLSSFVSQ